MKDLAEDYIAFEGSTLEEAYKKASLEFECSIINLKSDVIQTPSSGFFGFFKRSAIIKVYKSERQSDFPNEDVETKYFQDDEINIQDFISKIEKAYASTEMVQPHLSSKNKLFTPENKIFDSFYEKEVEDFKETKILQNDKILNEIKEKIDHLFSHLLYDMKPVSVSYYDDNTLLINFNGEDSALLIGKEGYRYKSLSYILFNWIHEKYNLMIRLEIAEFLITQEESMEKYLKPIIETIKIDGFCRTKNLDGILIHIALTRLRSEFPEKYIAVKSNIKGEKYILVNEYRK
jgi:spoIIIJ-associated protein